MKRVSHGAYSCSIMMTMRLLYFNSRVVVSMRCGSAMRSMKRAQKAEMAPTLSRRCHWDCREAGRRGRRGGVGEDVRG